MSEHALQTEGAQITSMIERLAKDPSVDADKLERLFALQTRARDDEAAERYNAAILAVQRDVESVIRHLSNDQTQSKYADLGAIMRMLKPILDRNAVAVQFGTADCPKPDHVRVTSRVSHGRHVERDFIDMPIVTTGLRGNANKTQTHATAEATTYGRRYLLCMVFNIPLADEDGNASSRVAKPIDQEQAAKIRELVEASGANLSAFLANACGGASCIEDIAAVDYVKVKAALETKLQRQRAGQ